MARCGVCGNDYDKSFSMRANGGEYVFDSFECAIHTLAPQCAHCRGRIIGHGIEVGQQVFCCAQLRSPGRRLRGSGQGSIENSHQRLRAIGTQSRINATTTHESLGMPPCFAPVFSDCASFASILSSHVSSSDRCP